MSDKELAQAIQEFINPVPPPVLDPRQMALEVIRREQRRVRLLAGLCVVFWLLAVAGLILLLVGLDRFVIFVRIARLVDEQGNHPAPDHRELDQYTLQMLHGTQLLHHSILLVGGSVLSMLLAGLCTVMLVFASRRATLHQIHLSLMTLSEQLKELRQAAGGGTSPPAAGAR